MTSFRRILSLPHTLYTTKASIINTACVNPGANNSFSKLLLIQSRCLFIKKSVKDLETEAEIKKHHDLFQLNYLAVNKNEIIDKINKSLSMQTCSSLSDVKKKIQGDPLDQKSMRPVLFEMLKLYKLERFSPDFSKEMNTFIKSEEFEKFSQILEQSLPVSSTKFLKLVFEVMHFYQIPCSSILMQKLHVLILDNINKFELIDVINMYLIIKDKDENLLKPLKDAFSAFMNHLTLDSLKVTGDLKSIIYFASKEEVPFSVREKILKKVLFLGFHLKDLNPTMLAWLSFPLCSKEFKFLDKSHFFNSLKETMNNFEYKELKIVLENISQGIHKKVIHYNENLFDLIAVRASHYELWAASSIMSNLLKLNHVNYELADTIAEKLIRSDKESLGTVRFEEIIINFGLIDYKNYLTKKSLDNWYQIETILMGYIESGQNFRKLHTFLSLFILELDSKELIEKALNNFVEVLESGKEVGSITQQRACLLYQCYCAVYSSPPENISEKILSEYLTKMKYLSSYYWKEAMYEAFNGEEYVLENCKTPFGILITYVVILTPEGNPINLSSYKKPKCLNSYSFDDFIEIEKIQRLPGSKLFAFIEYDHEIIKFRNVKLLKPKQRIISRIHKNLGYRIFHLYFNQKITNNGEQAKVLSSVMARELNYIRSKESESPTPEIINFV